MRTTPTRSRGSALLIVLGFLSFMTISAVSFAIYMRIERQASSNYRQTLEARHMLNTALFRAIEEIDSDLRDQTYTTTNCYKFPNYWNNRVRTSALEDSDDNDQDARVLSMEALSFVPGLLVNNVRRWAVRDSDDDDWMGVKWRELSMPVPSLGDSSGSTPSADGKAVIGRYAYVCVNVSDMLNVNDCTNRISIGQLFGTDSGAVDNYDKFLTAYQDTDRRYETLQDFYACMQQRRGSERGDETPTRDPKADTPFGSPFHTWMGGDSSAADAGYMYAGNQVLVTDGLAKPEPVREGACNIGLYQPVTLGGTYGSLQATFKTALNKVFNILNNDSSSDRLPANSVNAFIDSDVLPTLIGDYLDTDSVPAALHMPSVEMVPMISQIVIDNTAGAGGGSLSFQPKFIEETDNSTTPATTTKSLLLVGDLGGMLSLSVEVVWPYSCFKKQRAGKTFTVNAVLDFKMVRNGQTLTTKSDWTSPNFQLTGPTMDPALSADSFDEARIRTDQDKCYQRITLEFATSSVGNNNKIELTKNGAGLNGYSPAESVSVGCAVLVQILDQDGNIVDQAPCTMPNGTDRVSDWKQNTPKLYFQTQSAVISSAGAGQYLAYINNSLEIADPRFNYRAGDWVASSVANPQQVDAAMNTSTKDILGKDGRDADILMSVANTGSLQSPGELGFIVRPFLYDDGSDDDINLMTQTAISSSVPDYDAMFRTIRLYDHGDPSDLVNRAHDPVFDYFYVENTDGFIPGSRVNPLSNIPAVLEGAIWNTPFDYSTSLQKKVDQKSYRFGPEWDPTSWVQLIGKWTNAIFAIQTQLNKAPPSDQDWNAYTNRFSAYYASQSVLDWYSPNLNRTAIFASTMSKPLYEVDRKMLFSYSLDNFCDRQQLFLYILRAEKKGPQLGSAAELGTRSLAGGRAVALVWRDPYPTSGQTCGASGFDYYDKDRIVYWSGYHTDDQPATPWRQYYENDGKTSVSRRPEFHEHRILFFKQLDN